MNYYPHMENVIARRKVDPYVAVAEKAMIVWTNRCQLHLDTTKESSTSSRYPEVSDSIMWNSPLDVMDAPGPRQQPTKSQTDDD